MYGTVEGDQIVTSAVRLDVMHALVQCGVFGSLMKSDEQSRKINESCVSLGKCRSISASIEIVTHACPVSLADPVQQDPCVPPVPSPQYDWTLGASTTVTPGCMYLWVRYHRYNGINESLSAATIAAPALMKLWERLRPSPHVTRHLCHVGKWNCMPQFLREG